MGSSEIVDSAKFSVRRTNFSQTCSLLSQFLKEKGSFGEVTLGLSQNLENRGAPTGTMNLLPMIEKKLGHPDSGPKNLHFPVNLFAGAGRDEEVKKSDFSAPKLAAERAPMTIIYAGRVIVFNDFPVDKANEIMMFAAAQDHPFSPAAPPPPVTKHSPAESASSFAVQERANLTPPSQQFVSDLPIARKNSLARFLEKRKERITANEPYPARKPAATPLKAAGSSEAWLRLGPQIPSEVWPN